MINSLREPTKREKEDFNCLPLFVYFATVFPLSPNWEGEIWDGSWTHFSWERVFCVSSSAATPLPLCNHACFDDEWKVDRMQSIRVSRFTCFMTLPTTIGTKQRIHNFRFKDVLFDDDFSRVSPVDTEVFFFALF